MNPRIVSAICLFLVFGHALARSEFNEESYSEGQFDESSRDEKVSNDEAKTVVEDSNTDTSALVQNDDGDIVAAKHKGFCHWGVAVYYKPGFSIRCSCMKCTCQRGGKWDCAYNFAYCPYYYCGNQIYNPLSQICCCGKVYNKSSNYKCCGYFYYNTKTSKCCNYFSVKSLKSNCPRSKI